MKLLTQYIKRSHDFLWSSDIGASPALRRRLVMTLRTDVCGLARPRRRPAHVALHEPA
jgi:hypothetical protein